MQVNMTPSQIYAYLMQLFSKFAKISAHLQTYQHTNKWYTLANHCHHFPMEALNPILVVKKFLGFFYTLAFNSKT